MKNRTFVAVTLTGMISLIAGFVGMTVYVDPLFHYHAPTEGLEYPLFDERYMNDGIIRHFEYDAIITGSSMTQNFRTSTFDELFGTKSVKVPMSGANYNEINNLLTRAFSYQNDIKTVMRGLDMSMLIDDKDELSYDEYPDFLYDNNLWNDVYYVLNKEIFFKYTDYVFSFMAEGGKTSTFDAYKNWHHNYTYDAVALRKGYQRKELVEEELPLSDKDKQRLKENVEQNVLSLVKAHPETEFYLFIPPYSILYWDDQMRTGKLEQAIEAQCMLIEMLLPYENIHLYSFFDDYLMICDLSHYIDSLHYDGTVSEKIIQNMKSGVGLLTEENYEEYVFMLNFYRLFDYDGFFATE